MTTTIFTIIWSWRLSRWTKVVEDLVNVGDVGGPVSLIYCIRPSSPHCHDASELLLVSSCEIPS